MAILIIRPGKRDLIRRETGNINVVKNEREIGESLESGGCVKDPSSKAGAQRSVSSTTSSSSTENTLREEEVSLGAVLLYLTALEPLLRGGRGGGGTE